MSSITIALLILGAIVAFILLLVFAYGFIFFCSTATMAKTIRDETEKEKAKLRKSLEKEVREELEEKIKKEQKNKPKKGWKWRK